MNTPLDLDALPAELDRLGKPPKPEAWGRKGKPAAPKGEIVTEDSAALRFAELYRNELRYCHDTGAWFEWDGVVWKQDRTGRAFTWARELAREMAQFEPSKVRHLTSKTSFAAGVEKFARSDDAFAVTM
jgi:putative DNA primase/helicase